MFINLILISLTVCAISNGQLIVNVKNNGGDVYREHIEANITQDSIMLEFRKADGTMVTQFIDGRNEIQIFRVVILPEEELGQTQIQTMCFVMRFIKSEFISSDAMSKLRQKNPSTVRHPEEARPLETFVMDSLINVEASHVVSTQISEICKQASGGTYTRDIDLHQLSQILNRDYAILQSITEPVPVSNLSSCSDSLYDPQSSAPCLCHYDVCVGWYPCGLKYCRGKDSAGRIVSYRCGIKTCSRCRRFEFRVSSKGLCIWDEPEFQLGRWQSESDSPAAVDTNAESANSNGDNAETGQEGVPESNNQERNQPVEHDLGGINKEPNNSVMKMRQYAEPSDKPAEKPRIRNPQNPSENVNKPNIKTVGNPPRNVPDDDEDGE